MSQRFTPRAYQHLIIDHIIDNRRCGVWAGMGLGKSASTLKALDMLSLVEGDVFPALVVAPLRVARSTWPDEAAKWQDFAHLKVRPVVGPPEDRAAALKSKAHIYTINYENLPWLVETLGDKWPFKTIVADESTKLKGFRLRQGTKRAQSLARVAHTRAKRFINLTGTPAPNGLADLWGQTWFLDSGERLGRNYTAFEQRWFRPNFNGFGVTPMPHAQPEIESKLKDLCLSLDAGDYFDIDKPIVHNVYVDLPEEARARYDEMEKELFTELEGHEVEAFNAAARTMKCLQLANGAAYVGEDADKWVEVHDEKLQALEDIIEEAAGMPVLVAYHFRSDLARLRKAFGKSRVLDKDPQTIRDWNDGKIPVLLAHPASAGHGLNLQDGGNILVFFGHNWNLEEYQQIIERIGPTRQAQAGHKRPVFIYHIIARKTVDQLVMARRESKREVQDLLLEAMKARQQ